MVPRAAQLIFSEGASSLVRSINPPSDFHLPFLIVSATEAGHVDSSQHTISPETKHLFQLYSISKSEVKFSVLQDLRLEVTSMIRRYARRLVPPL